MQIIITLFAAITNLLLAIFANVQTFSSQFVELGQKLLAKIEKIKNDLTADLTAKYAEFTAEKQAMANRLSAVDATITQKETFLKQYADSAANGKYDASIAYTDGQIANVKLAAQTGMQGIVGVNIGFTDEDLAEGAPTKTVELADVADVIAGQFGNTGQYHLDFTFFNGKDEEIDNMIDFVIGGKKYTVRNDEKIVVYYDAEKAKDNFVDAVSYRTIDRNYTAKILTDLQTSLVGMQSTLEAVKAQSDYDKAVRAEFLNNI